MLDFNLEEYKQLLATLVSFQTVVGNEDEFTRAIAFLEKYCNHNHLQLTKYQNYLIIEKNNQVPELEFFTHLDVVPTTNQKWDTDPYQLVERDEKLFGRGVIDDKGPLAAILLLLKNSTINHNLRLFVGYYEETSFTCIKEYNHNHPAPKLGIVSDAKFPVIFGEKGSAHFKLTLPLITKVQDTTNAPNTVVDNFITECGSYYGTAAHSSKAKLEDNAIYKYLVKDYPQVFKQMLTFEEDELGITIYNPTTVTTIGDQLEVYFDVRYTKEAHLKQLSTAFNVELIDSKPAKYAYDERVVKLLMDCYTEVTGDTDNQPRTSTAGTYSSYLDNTYVYGFAAPGEEGNVHLANEQIKLETIEKGYKIYQLLIEKIEMGGN